MGQTQADISNETLSEWQSNDPDIKLCNDLTIDAAVISDDGLHLVFKDQYYWLINKYGSGLEEDYAKPISQRYSALKHPIDAAFTLVDELGQWSTIFINVRHIHSSMKL